MKAVIPVAGVGTKLRPHTFTQPKPLIPVAGKPIISYIIDKFLEIGIDEFVIIIGYLGDKIKSYIDETYPTLSVEFVYQEYRRGIGHAIWTATDVLAKEEEIIIALGDTIVDIDLKDFVDSNESVIGIHRVEDPQEFGVVMVDEEGYIKKAVEKPTIPKSNLAIVGIYKIKEVQQLLTSLDRIITTVGTSMDEFSLTDALMDLVEEGAKIKAVAVNKWFDCGKRDILLETNATLLAIQDTSDIVVDSFDNTIFIHPVAIGENCSIRNSIIGPNVSIGTNTSIQNSIVDNSIIGSFSELIEIVLRRSIVGNDALVKGQHLSLNIGENTEIDFG